MAIESGNGFVPPSSGGGGGSGGIVPLDFNDLGTSINPTTYTIQLYAPYAYTINKLYIQCTSGTATASVQINGVSVTGISAVSVSSVLNSGTASALNVVAIGNTITVVITSTTSLNNLKGTIVTTLM